MGLAAAHHDSIGLAGAADVVGVGTFTTNQLGIFAATDRLADTEFGQRKRGFCSSVIHCGIGGLWGGVLSNRAARMLRQELLLGRRVARGTGAVTLFVIERTLPQP